MNNGGLINVSGDTGKTVSNWNKPGGTLGMIVAAGIILTVLYFLLPILSTIAWNAVSLACAGCILALIIFLLTDKSVKRMVSVGYFMLMRSITGFFVEIDPIAIVERRIIDMKKKIQQISKIMGDVKGLIGMNKMNIRNKQAEYENALLRMEACEKKGDKPAGQVARNQAVRLDGVIKAKKERLEKSEKWYEVLSKMEEMANLTVEDTENEVAVRKEEYESIKAQHKAFKSVMSIMSGDPDEMAIFTQAMDFMASDMNAKLGEMEHVLDSTGGLLAQYSLDNDVTNSKADALLKKYEDCGINGMFDTFNSKEAEPVKLISDWQTPLSQTKSQSAEIETKKTKYF